MSTSQQLPDIGKEIDRQLSRRGWGTMLTILVVLFCLIYIFINLFQLPMQKRSIEVQNLNLRIEQLEQRLEQLEQLEQRTAE